MTTINDCETCIHNTKEAEDEPCASCEETADGWTRWEGEESSGAVVPVPLHEKRCGTCVNALVGTGHTCNTCGDDLKNWGPIVDMRLPNTWKPGAAVSVTFANPVAAEVGELDRLRAEVAKWKEYSSNAQKVYEIAMGEVGKMQEAHRLVMKFSEVKVAVDDERGTVAEWNASVVRKRNLEVEMRGYFEKHKDGGR